MCVNTTDLKISGEPETGSEVSVIIELEIKDEIKDLEEDMQTCKHLYYDKIIKECELTEESAYEYKI